MLQSIWTTIEAIAGMPKLLMSRDSANYYQYLGDDVVEGQHSGFSDSKPLWLNLGHWKTARTYPEACAALATALADAAHLGVDDHLLDVGFGFAEQDFLWIERYGVKKITGLNITPLHVERAQARAKERGLADRMDLRLGSATDMPFEPASFDKVTALECAFHFDTRERFFQEAFRVLKPGGTLALADGAPMPGAKKPGFVQKLALKRWSVPLANIYDRDEYCRKLEAAGFVNVRAESIRNYVFPGCTKYRELRNQGISMQDAVIELTDEEIERCAGIEKWEHIGMTDYVLFSGDKPR